MIDYGDKILNTSRDLFFKFGLRSVTMDDISRELCMSKKTLYQQYSSKNDLINTLTSKFFIHFETHYNKVVENSKDAIDELLLLMEDFRQVMERMDKRIIYDMQRFFPETLKKVRQHKQEFMLKKIVANLEKGIAQGIYRHNINIPIISQLRLEEIQLAIDPDIFPPGKFELDHIHNVLLLHYLHGIVTLKGRKLINKYLKIEED